MKDSPTSSERPLYLYITLAGNLIAVGGMTFLLLGVLGALGLITAITDSLGGLGSSFASATTGSAIEYSFAFLAALIALSASWKMFREGPIVWLLAIVVVFQGAAAAVFHSWVSVIVLIPAAGALYGLVVHLAGRSAAPASATARAQPDTGKIRPAEPPSVEPRSAEPQPADFPSAEPAQPVSGGARPMPETLVPLGRETAAPTDDGSEEEVLATPSRACADCGALNPRTARFCGSCGSILPG